MIEELDEERVGYNNFNDTGTILLPSSYGNFRSPSIVVVDDGQGTDMPKNAENNLIDSKNNDIRASFPHSGHRPLFEKT